MDTTLSDYERLGPDGGPCGAPLAHDGPNGREGPKNGESAWPVALWHPGHGPGTGYVPSGYRLIDRAGYYLDVYDTVEGIDWLDRLQAMLNHGGPARERALKQMVRLPPAPPRGAPSRASRRPR